MRRAVNILLVLGAAIVVYRAFAGLGAVTALSDAQPWGLVKAVNIFTGAALAAGSFTVAAAVYVFGLRHMKQLVRPALLMGFIGHGFVLLALLYDVGRPLDVWRIITNPQSHSALLWTAWCELAYTTVMFVELLPDITGKRTGLIRAVERAKPALVVFAATLAVVYQSTLGTLFLASPHRISPLWYSPTLPAQFFVSAAAAGLAAVVFEAYASDRACRRLFDIDYIKGIGWIMFGLLVIYLTLRLGELFMAGALICAMGTSCLGGHPVWLAFELGLGFALPAFMLLFGYVRNRRRGLVWVSLFVMTGVLMNRVGVTIIGWENPPGEAYSPSALEWLSSAFFVLAAVAIYWRLSGRLIHDVAPYGPESFGRLRQEERAD